MTARDDRDRRFRLLERATASPLPRRAYTVVRLDGRSFSRFTRSLDKPFDAAFTAALLDAAEALLGEFSGSLLTYAQSDEVSLVASDLIGATTQPWFGGDLQKTVSVAASLVTAEFARRFVAVDPRVAGVATFDARAFVLATPDDVLEYVGWRQSDAVRNSISMAATRYMSHRERHGRPITALLDDLRDRFDVDWTDYPAANRLGTFGFRLPTVADVEFTRSDGTRDVAEGVLRQVPTRASLDVTRRTTRALLRRVLTRGPDDDPAVVTTAFDAATGVHRAPTTVTDPEEEPCHEAPTDPSTVASSTAAS